MNLRSFKAINFILILAMILTAGTTFAEGHPGTIKLYDSEMVEEGNRTMFEHKEDVNVKMEKFPQGDYLVTVKAPGGDGTILGEGEISVPEEGDLIFNLYEETEFMATDNKAGVYTVVVGENKVKNFKLVNYEADPDDPDDPDDPIDFNDQEENADKLIRDEGFIPIANGNELDKLRNEYPDGELFGEGTFWEGEYITTGLTDSYVQVADIDLSDFEDWESIGGLGEVYFEAFEGTFDGNGYAISNLKDIGDTEYIGLFGYVSGATINNIIIQDPIIMGDYFGGALAGYIENSYIANISVEKINNQDSIISGNSVLGGLVGSSMNSTFEDLFNEVDVEGEGNVGGILGEYYDFDSGRDDFLVNAENRGNVTGSSSLGGIVGTSTGIMENLVNQGQVRLLDRFYASKYLLSYGGIAGLNNGSITDARNYGDVWAFEPDSDDINNMLTGIGGIAGSNSGNGIIIDSQNHGSILGEKSVGGIAGANGGEIYDSINFGHSVQGLSNVGGIAGQNYNGIIERTLNFANIEGESFTGGVTGVSEIRPGPIKTSISESVNIGAVSGGRYTGGISGYLHYDRALDSYNVGPVSGEYWTGGGFGLIIGSEVSRTYSSAEVMGSVQTGGLLGTNNTSQVTDSFFNEALAPLAGSTGITPLSNDEMAKLESFTGFDFGGTWSIIPDESYPFLQWQEGIFIPEKLILE
ncbi:MAG: hypothetical protein NUK57_02605 [Gudongella sp.]|nr:hypothetical protein [Gudongella sp.]